jgi:hypothetical protein
VIDEATGDGDRSRVDARSVLGSLLETGDKAKGEAYRLIAREVRAYLEALELHKDLHHLITNYSLEVQASVHLKPLDEVGEASVSVGLRPLHGEEDAPSEE